MKRDRTDHAQLVWVQRNTLDHAEPLLEMLKGSCAYCAGIARLSLAMADLTATDLEAWVNLRAA